MSRQMNWAGAANRDRVQERGADAVEPEGRTPRSRKTNPGIAPSQAKELARLQRAAGRRYTGNGMTAAQADAAIDSLRTGTRRA